MPTPQTTNEHCSGWVVIGHLEIVETTGTCALCISSDKRGKTELASMCKVKVSKCITFQAGENSFGGVLENWPEASDTNILPF